MRKILLIILLFSGLLAKAQTFNPITMQFGGITSGSRSLDSIRYTFSGDTAGFRYFWNAAKIRNYFNTTTGTSTLSLLAGKQATLVSGTNIKTVNSTSLLGSGDIPFPTSLPTPFAATFNNSGSGSASGTTFDGSAARTISYNTIGAQPTGNYITALTGDGTASGPGSATLTLATVNANTGSFGTASNVPTITYNGKGLATSVVNTPIQIAESQVTNLPADLAAKQLLSNLETTVTNSPTLYTSGSAVTTALLAYYQSLIPTAVKTANYTLIAQDLAKFDNSSGNLVATLPNAPADKTLVAVKLVIQGTTNTIAVNTSGSDVFNKTGGGTTYTLKLLNQSVLMQYQSTGAIWNILSDDLPLGQLDTRYQGTLTAGSGISIISNTISATGATTTAATLPPITFTSTWNGYGDSIFAGASASPSSNSFPNLLASTTATFLTNRAVSGTGVRDVIFSAFTNEETVNVTHSSVTAIGTNDLIASATSSTVKKVGEGIKVVLANHFLDTFIPISSSTITKAGTWSNLTTTNISSKSVIKSLGTPILSTAAGSTLTFPFLGNNLVIGTWGVQANHTTFGRFSVTIDGINYGTFDVKGKADDWYYATAQTFDIRMPNVVVLNIPEGKHNVVITTLDNLEVDFDYIGRMALPPYVKSTIIGHILYMNAAGRLLGNAHSSIAKIDSANRLIDTVANIFSAIGEPVAVAKPENNLDTLTCFSGTDGLHPNNSGHAQIFTSYIELVTYPRDLILQNSNTDVTNALGAGSMIKLVNPSATGQNVISNMINGVLQSKTRYDNGGNIANVSYGGGHYWFLGGDSGVGSIGMSLTSSLLTTNVNSIINGTHTVNGAISTTGNTNGAFSTTITNSNAGSSAFAGVNLVSNAGSAFLYRTSSTYSVPNTTFLQDASGGNIVLTTTGTGIGIKNNNPLYPLDVTGTAHATTLLATTFDNGNVFNTTTYSARIGSFYIQPFALNNGFITDNAIFNGSSWTRLNTGYAVVSQFVQGQYLVAVNPSGSGTFTPGYAFKVDNANSGTVAMGGTISPNSNNYTGASMVVNGSGAVQINSLTASTALVSDASKNVVSSATTSAQIGYLSTTTSDVQTQLNAKGVGTVTSVTSPNTDIGVATGTTTPVLTFNRGGTYTWTGVNTFNNSTVFGSGATFNSAITMNQQIVHNSGYQDVYYNSANTFNAVFGVNTLTANRTATLPDDDGTVALTKNINAFITGTPTIAAGAGAGTSPTVSVTTNGKQLQVTVTTGTLPTGTNATIATVTLASALSYTPYPVFSSANAATSLLNGASMVYMTSTGASNVTITAGTTALVAATSYVWNIAL